MPFGLLPKLLPAAFLIAMAIPAISQTTYDAREGGLPLSFGAGVSNFDPYLAQDGGPLYGLHPGFGYGRMWGVAAWADAGAPLGPPWLHNFGLEARYQSIFAAGSPNQANIKEASTGGGAIYTLHRWRSFRPYGKYIFSLSRVDFTGVPEFGGGTYSHDSRATNSLGTGIEFRTTRHLWARIDYEYQLWGSLFGVQQFQPQGLTAGVMYDFRKSRVR